MSQTTSVYWPNNNRKTTAIIVIMAVTFSKSHHPYSMQFSQKFYSVWYRLHICNGELAFSNCQSINVWIRFPVYICFHHVLFGCVSERKRRGEEYVVSHSDRNMRIECRFIRMSGLCCLCWIVF